MSQYVEYVADFLLWKLGVSTMYGQTNPVRIPTDVYVVHASDTTDPISSPSWRVPPSRCAQTFSIVRCRITMARLYKSTPMISTTTDRVVRRAAPRYQRRKGGVGTGHIAGVELPVSWTIQSVESEYD